MHRIDMYIHQNVTDQSLFDRIIQFDRVNMKEALELADVPFDEEKRRSFFKKDEHFIIATDEDEIVGYLEYGTSKTCSEDIYVTSIQLSEAYRKGMLIGQLLGIAVDDVLDSEFKRLTCHVHKVNQVAMNLYLKLGFILEDIEGNDKQYFAHTSIEALQKGIFYRSYLRTQSRIKRNQVI